MNPNNEKLFGEKYSLEEKYNYLVLFDDSTVILPQLLMMLWQQDSIEAAKMDLQWLQCHSLITQHQSSNDQYILHSLHVAYLCDQNWTEIQQYRQDCIDKIRSYCCGKWFLVDNTDGNLWKILFQCCKLLYKRPDDFPCGLVTDLRVWNAYARARGLANLYNELRRCIGLSSLPSLRQHLQQLLLLIQRLPNDLINQKNSHEVTFEFVQHALFKTDMKSECREQIVNNIEADDGTIKPFYWTTILDDKDTDIKFQWKCWRHGVDYKNGIVYAAHRDRRVDILTRNKEIKQIMLERIINDDKNASLYNFKYIEYVNFLVVLSEKKNRFGEHKGQRCAFYNCKNIASNSSLPPIATFDSHLFRGGSIQLNFLPLHSNARLLMSYEGFLCSMHWRGRRGLFGRPQLVHKHNEIIQLIITINIQFVLLLGGVKLTFDK